MRVEKSIVNLWKMGKNFTTEITEDAEKIKKEDGGRKTEKTKNIITDNTGYADFNKNSHEGHENTKTRRSLTVKNVKKMKKF